MCISKQRNPPFREYTFCNTTLAYVEKDPFLGVTLDANLRWNHHLHELSSKANKTLTLIKRNFWFCDEDAKCLLYKTLVRPKLEYASVLVQDPHYLCDVNKLENIQRPAPRFCKGDYKYSSSVTSVRKGLEWEPMQNVQNFKWHHSLNKSKYLTPATETRTRGSHGFNILLKIQVKNSEGMEQPSFCHYICQIFRYF